MEREEVSSTNLAAVGYDSNAQILEVEFISGHVYHYYDVPQNVHDELMSASSVGTYLNHYIKGTYNFAQV